MTRTFLEYGAWPGSRLPGIPWEPGFTGTLPKGTRLLWVGRNWGVTSFGIQSIAGAYGVAADKLLEREPFSGSFIWPIKAAQGHMADPTDFLTAWLVALAMLQPVETTDYGREKQPRPEDVQKAIAEAVAMMEGKP